MDCDVGIRRQPTKVFGVHGDKKNKEKNQIIGFVGERKVATMGRCKTKDSTAPAFFPLAYRRIVCV